MHENYSVYRDYQLGIIYPEKLPGRILELINLGMENDDLLFLASLSKPTRLDIERIDLEKAFEINHEHRLNPEKWLDISFDLWQKNKIDFVKLWYFNETCIIKKCKEIGYDYKYLEHLISQYSKGNEWIIFGQGNDPDEYLEELRIAINFNPAENEFYKH